MTGLCVVTNKYLKAVCNISCPV